MATPVHTPPQALVDLLLAVEDQAQERHHAEEVGETFISCRLCGEWEGHTDACPIPAIETWLGT